MTNVDQIGLPQLLIALLPVLPLLFIYWRWQLETGRVLYAIGRMLLQLLLIGFLLTYLFELQQPLWMLAVMLVMLGASAWIALGVVEAERWLLLKPMLIALGLAGGLNLLVVLLGVLQLDPWYQPRYLIPLAGMILANAMNSVSLCAERMRGELQRGVPFMEARAITVRAAMIPTVNMLLAVGLVSLPGMMTGQILSGVSPWIAARYQIMVMTMVLSASGLSVVLFLMLARDYYQHSVRAEGD